MMKYPPLLFILLGLLQMLSCSNSQKQLTIGTPVEQVSIARIDSMPYMPQPYKMLDWRAKAVEFDNFVFDHDNRVKNNPLIWLDNSRRNLDQTTFGLYTAIGDCRQGPDNNNGEFHESLNSLAALLGAGLIDIDKTNQNGYNYVKMVQNYFNTENEWNIIMNNTSPQVGMLGGGYGRDWWYDVFPNALYYAVCDVFPNVNGADEIMHIIAEQFTQADSVLNGNYNYSYFDYSTMEGKINHIPLQQDAAGGHAWVLYAAYKKFGDPRYLAHARSAMDALMQQNESRFYEILLPLSAIVAARLNAEEGDNYDVKKILDWTFNGCQNPNGRYGWGVICDRWGDYDVSGLQGSIVDGGGYAFFMNSVKLAWPLIPLVKYEPQYANAIGQWMLNMANACRLFYPNEIADTNQWLPEMKNLTHDIIAYEGLRKSDLYNKESLSDVSPVALGDGPNWTSCNPPESMFSIYSTSPVGILGAIVDTTNVQGILRLDCNATDFYANRPYPVYLYYNPHNTKQSITYHADTAVDLFDIVSKQYKAHNVNKNTHFTLPAHQAAVIVELPAGTHLHTKDNYVITDENIIISYK